MIMTGLISGFLSEDKKQKRSVDMISAASAQTTYFQDRNPDRTHVVDFNKLLRKQQEELQLREKKLRNLRVSDDLKEINAWLAQGKRVICLR